MECLLCHSTGDGILISDALYVGKNASASFIKISEKHKVRQCTTCGHKQLDPLPTEQEDLEFYENDVHSKELFGVEDVELRQRADTLRRANMIRGLLNSGSILDFGCGFGFFVGALSNDYRALGVDVCASRLELAESWNSGNFKQFDPQEDLVSQFDQKFDVVCAFHVLEHLRDPVKAIKEWFELLNPGGQLVLEVPNAGDPMLEEIPGYNKFFWQRMHLSYFDDSRMELAILRAGCSTYTIKHVQRYGLENLVHWAHNNGPQYGAPTFSTLNPALTRAEDVYKRDREETKSADTLVAIIKKS